MHVCKSKAIQLQACQEVEAPRISRQLTHESGKVVSFTHRPLLPPGDMYVCMYVAHALIELNTSGLFIHIAFIEEEGDDDYDSLLTLVVVTSTFVIVICNLFILFILIMSTKIYITIINFVAVCFWLAAFRK
jgi:hypothetical protein